MDYGQWTGISFLYARIKDWCRGKNWAWRMPIILLFVYVFIRHLRDPMYSSIFGALNLGIHELGHLLFAFFGEFLCIAGGTFMQLFIPLAGVINFFRQEDYFGIAFAFGWLSTSLFDVARYIGDARAMDLPLVRFFWADDVKHDWNYLLSRMGIIQFDTNIAMFVKVLAVISMLVCLIMGTWLVILMIREPASESIP